MTNESAIINNDSPLPIPRQLARWLGWNEAGILQQLHWHTQEGHGQTIDGVRWIRMSETEWLEEIPLDEKAIQRAIKNLEADGLIRSAVFSGRCKWYTVCYGVVESLTGPVERITQKSETRKKARATRQDAKVQIVPIDINDYTQEQSVPTKPKEQIVPIIGTKCTYEWVQNVPLQESSRVLSRDSLLIDAHMREVYDRIGQLCKTNFFNPNNEPYRTALIKACQDYTPQKVLWAIEVALSPEKANGMPKTWGYVVGILESDKNGTYEAKRSKYHQNGATNGHKPTKQQRQQSPILPVTPEEEAQLRRIEAALANDTG